MDNKIRKTDVSYEQEYKNLRRLIDRAVHQIRSPLASLLVIVKASRSISAKEEAALRQAIMSINDIANSLLNNRQQEITDSAELDARQNTINPNQTESESDLKQVQAVFVDDDLGLLNSFTFFVLDKKIDTYHDPQHFLDNVSRYSKDTKIMLDYHFDNSNKNGIQIAQQLHALGFTQLYLFSGKSSFDRPIPEYLTCIAKTDLDKLTACLNT
jgi:hypothetical protein